MTNDISGLPLFRTTSQNHTSSPPWVYDSAFGIVHYNGCRICRSYMMHLSDVDESDINYAHAIHNREEELRNRFLGGFRRGRDTQRQHDNDLLRRYRSQRDSARDAQSLSELRLEEGRGEIAQLRDELLALRIAYDELRPRTPLEDSDWSDHDAFRRLSDGFEPDESDFSVAPSGVEESSSDDESDSSLAPSGAEESSSDDESEEEFWAPVLACMESGDEDVESRTDGPRNRTSDLVEALNQQSSEIFVETDEIPHLSIFGLRFVTEDEPGPSGTANAHSSLYQLKSPPPSRPLSPSVYLRRPECDALEEIRKEMKLASHPDNGHVLLRVKALVSEAHRTPARERTEIQKVLLSEWRRPSVFPLTWGPPISIPSSDVYVDASQMGIGFVFGDEWQAWELKKGWKTRTREIQWAEAAAVELGLRLMIQTGFYGKTLRLRSDNSGVVEAVSKREFNQSQVGEIVKHVDRLCRLYDITLKVEWIAGEDNPADAPSRLRPRKGSQRFPCAISIPAHLQEFVLPYNP